jgi:hypothetical protein
MQLSEVFAHSARGGITVIWLSPIGAATLEKAGDDKK